MLVSLYFYLLVIIKYTNIFLVYKVQSGWALFNSYTAKNGFKDKKSTFKMSRVVSRSQEF